MSTSASDLLPSFAQAAALVSDLAQLVHLRIIGHNPARNDLCALLYCSFTLHLGQLESENPAKMAAVIDLLRSTIAQHDGKQADTGGANPVCTH